MSKKLAVILISLCAVITLASVVTVVVVLMGREEAPSSAVPPDYAPKDEEPNAEPIPDDTGEAPETSDGGSVSLLYSPDVTVDLSEGKVTLLFGNPRKSNQDMVLQVVIRDRVILQSGRITPGNRVTVLELSPDGPRLGAGKYLSENCKFVVSYYDPVSGERAMLNTEIPVTVTVSE